MTAILFKDGIEVRRGKYPDVEMRLVTDLPNGYEWKLLLDGETPIANEIETIERTEVDNGNSHPNYPHLKVIDIVYSKVKKSDDNIIQMINNYEDRANENMVGHSGKLKLMFLYMAIVHRKQQGLNISAKMQAILDKGDAKAVKLWQNDTTLKSKLKDVTDGKDPNVKNRWTNE